nr:hypothetical protein Iba_chr02cCG9860 [Ipomoea batatas]
MCNRPASSDKEENRERKDAEEKGEIVEGRGVYHWQFQQLWLEMFTLLKLPLLRVSISKSA